MLVDDAQFTGFRGAIRQHDPRFTTRVDRAGDFDPWASRFGRSGVPLEPGVVLQRVIAPKGSSRPCPPAHLGLKGLVSRTAGVAVPRDGWESYLSVLADRLGTGGDEVLATWDGDFILAGYVSASRRFLLYRSLTCSKSVYYRLDDGILTFSTNPLDLLPSGQDARGAINIELLPVLVTGGRYAPTRSCYGNLRRLPTGHLLTLEDGAIGVRQVAAFAPAKLGRISLAEAADATRGELLACARRALSPGQQIGVFISGGIDSAAVAAIAQAAGADVTAIHFSAEGYGPADEHTFADSVCRHLHLPQVSIPIVPLMQAGGRYVDTSHRFPLPFAGSFFQWYAMAAEQAGAHGLQTLTTGSPADQIFGGTNTPDVRSLLARLMPRAAWTFATEFLGTYVPLDRVLRSSTGRRAERLARLTDPPEVPDAAQFLTTWAFEAAAEHGRYRDASNWDDVLSQAIASSTMSTLNTEFDSAYELAALLPRGIQVTRLLADRDLINFGLGLPPAYRWFPAGGQFYEKAALRLAFVDLLPPDIVSRNFRTYLDGVNDIYCRNNRRVLTDLLSSASWLARLGVIEPQGIERVLADQRSLPAATGDLVAAAMVELWLRSLDGRREESRAAD